MPALRPLRRGQLVGVFGVGSMVDFPRDESLMMAGIDAWPLANQQCPQEWLVIEERLQARLGVEHFRLPPEFRDPAPGVQRPGQKVPFVRFPRWHYCPRCGSMRFLPLFESGRVKCRGDAGTACRGVPDRRRPYLIPVRFVAACGHGHIEDFPFSHWVHEGAGPGEGHHLRWIATSYSASLAGIRIRCSCGANRSLQGAFDFDMQRGGALSRVDYFCRGDRPWLGESGGQPGRCGEHLRVVQRGASNVYFPHIVSSIYLPLWAEGERPEIIRAIDEPRIWRALTSGLEDGRRIQLEKCVAVALMLGLDPEELRNAAQRRLDGVGPEPSDGPDSEEAFRRSEYEAIKHGRGDENTDLLVDVHDAASYEPWIGRYISTVCLVRKLRETRAQAGFSRIIPPSGPRDPRLQRLSLAESHSWLPATVIRGEGIFVELRADAIQAWLSTGKPRERIAGLSTAYNSSRQARGLEPRYIPAKFVLIHSLAHVFIKQLSFECGYGSASLRERVYCEVDPESDPMQGFLIYTASGDSEGTLGGLVRQGERGRFESTLMAALQNASWCSSDPVCIESKGQGTESANLAACHACLLLSETSCEEGNRLLDRGVLVGLMADSETGFMADLAGRPPR
jgi:hypothetical protein